MLGHEAKAMTALAPAPSPGPAPAAGSQPGPARQPEHRDAGRCRRPALPESPAAPRACSAPAL